MRNLKKAFAMAACALLVFMGTRRLHAATVVVDGRRVETVDMKLEIDGTPRTSPLPIFAKDDATYVPLRFVSETMGYRVLWLQSTKTVQVSKDGRRIWFPVGKNIVNTNDRGKITLPENVKAIFVAIPGQTDLSTYVPVRILSEYMGRKVEWDAATNTVVIRDGQPASVDLIAEAPKAPQAPSQPEVKPNPDPQNAAIVSDVENPNPVTLSAIEPVTEDTQTNRLNLKFGQKTAYRVETQGDLIRIVIPNGNAAEALLGGRSIPLLHAKDMIIERARGGLVFTFRTNGKKLSIRSSQDAKTITVSDLYTFQNPVSEERGTKPAVRLPGLGKQRYQKSVLDNPKRIVLDFYDMELAEGVSPDQKISAGFIQNIRVSQFQTSSGSDEKKVRVVLDIDPAVKHPDVHIATEGDDLVLYPEKSLYDYFAFRTTGSDRYLTIRGAESSTPYHYDASSNRLTMQLRGDIPDGSIDYNDNLVKGLSVQSGFLTVEFLRNVEIQPTGDREFTLQIHRLKTGKNSDYLIMIDPGHGGTDPGAISPIDGTSEKDVILPVQRSLEAKLLAMGYRVVKTNDTIDSYIPVKKRAEMANSLRPDVFVSLHANSAESQAAKGVEVLFCSEDKCSNKEPNQQQFAEYVRDEIEAAIGRKGRGIKNRPEIIVVGKTNMSAVLVEMGFLTDPEELSLMKTEAYQQQMVDAIIRAIERFLRDFK